MLAHDAAIEALNDAEHSLHDVLAMRETAYMAALDATGGDRSTAQSVVDDAVDAHITGRL